MNPSLDLSLPEPPRRRERALLGLIHFLATIACVALVAFLVVRDRGRSASEGRTAAEPASEASRLRQLAENLELRTLYAQAARVWEDYARASAQSPEEAAETVYRRGKCLKEAGEHSEAARLFTEVEQLPLGRDEKRNANRLLLECLSALGKEEARVNALRAFTNPGAAEKGTVVARVGGDEITLEEVRKDLHEEALRVLRLREPHLNAADLERKADELARSQLQDPQRAAQAVQQAVAGQVLYREGLARGYGQGREYEDTLLRFRRGHLAQRVIEDEIDAALRALGPTELRNHYDAHLKDYVEKPAVEFSYLKAASEDEAKAALVALGAGGDQAAAAAEKFTRSTQPAVQGEPLPGIGAAAEATAQLFSLEEGKTSERPVRAAGAWCLFRADAKRPERQLSFEEAQERVRADLAAVKQREAVAKLQSDLAAKFTVEIVDAERMKKAILGEKEPAEKEPAPGSAPDEKSKARAGD
jgi:hypothetical protein